LLSPHGPPLGPPLPAAARRQIGIFPRYPAQTLFTAPGASLRAVEWLFGSSARRVPAQTMIFFSLIPPGGMRPIGGDHPAPAWRRSSGYGYSGSHSRWFWVAVCICSARLMGLPGSPAGSGNQPEREVALLLFSRALKGGETLSATKVMRERLANKVKELGGTIVRPARFR